MIRLKNRFNLLIFSLSFYGIGCTSSYYQIAKQDGDTYLEIALSPDRIIAECQDGTEKISGFALHILNDHNEVFSAIRNGSSKNYCLKIQRQVEKVLKSGKHLSMLISGNPNKRESSVIDSTNYEFPQIRKTFPTNGAAVMLLGIINEHGTCFSSQVVLGQPCYDDDFLLPKKHTIPMPLSKRGY
jgi:hypothetical protein